MPTRPPHAVLGYSIVVGYICTLNLLINKIHSGRGILLVGGASLIWGCGLSRGNNVLVFEDGKQQPTVAVPPLRPLRFWPDHLFCLTKKITHKPLCLDCKTKLNVVLLHIQVPWPYHFHFTGSTPGLSYLTGSCLY